MELETHLLIAQRLGYVRSDQVEPVLIRTAELGRMLAALSRSLKRKIKQPVSTAEADGLVGRNLTPET
jgi:hypothetical protein